MAAQHEPSIATNRDRRHCATVAALLFAAGLLASGGSAARAAGFVADLSDHLIAITTAFTGTEVLLFGALEPPDGPVRPGDGGVAVVVRGPETEAGVRRKARVGPVWAFTAEERFRDVPSFYAVASSKPLPELAEPAELARHQIGVDDLRLEPSRPGRIDKAEHAAFRAALIRGKQRQGLYPERVGRVSFLGGALFRTRLAFPAGVPPGTYDVQVFQFEGGRVTHAQASTLDISKVGLEADLYDLAKRRPAPYALAAILAAVLAGWGASVLFRRA